MTKKNNEEKYLIEIGRKAQDQKIKSKLTQNELGVIFSGILYGTLGGLGWVLAGWHFVALIPAVTIGTVITYLMVKLNAAEKS